MQSVLSGAPPKAADVELPAKNGPLSTYDLDAKLTARAVSGPISLIGSSGEADVSAANGPVDLNGNSGKLRLNTENGPISVSLKGDSWRGSGLEADAQNGPLTLRVPRITTPAFSLNEQKFAGELPDECMRRRA